MILGATAARRVLDCDVCVVGAGLVGIYLATALHERGHRVVIVEVGSSKATAPPPPEFISEPYEGASAGRFLGLGGTSTAWGGQLAPMAAHELDETLPGQPEPWPIRLEELAPHYASVLSRYGIEGDALQAISRSSPQSDRVIQAPGFALSLHAGARNAARHWRRSLAASGIEVILEASIASIEVGSGRRVRAVTFLDRDGTHHTAHAKGLVVCAGAIASTELVQQFLAAAASVGGVRPGTMLQDHLSLCVGELEITNLEQFRSTFSPRLSKDGILFRRSFCRQPGGVSGFLHAVYAEPDGFPAWLHRLLRAVQNGALGETLSEAMQIHRHLMPAATLAKGIALRKRVEWPRRTRFELLLDVEQLPDPSNQILERRTANAATRIHWRATPADIACAKELMQRIRGEWDNSELGRGARLLTRSENAPVAKVAYHPTGTLRMSSEPSAGSVDAQCRVHGLENAFVLSTAVFPRCGAGNPSFTLLALASRSLPAIESALP